MRKYNLSNLINDVDELLDPFLEIKVSSFLYMKNEIPDYYKKPIISTNLSRTKLIKQLWALRKNSLVREESKRILAVHVRTKS